MAGKRYAFGHGPIVEDGMGQRFRLGVDDDGNITATRAHPLLDDEYYPHGALPRFIQPDNSQLEFHTPFATPPETPDPAGTHPAARPDGTATVGTPGGRPPLLGKVDGNTFWSNLDGQVGSDGQPYNGYIGNYYANFAGPAWFRIHAKTVNPITLDTQLGFVSPSVYPNYYPVDRIAVFDMGIANNGVWVQPPYYIYPYALSNAYGAYRPSGGYAAQVTFTPQVGHYYFVVVGSNWPEYYSSYGYAVRLDNYNLRWSGINQ